MTKPVAAVTSLPPACLWAGSAMAADASAPAGSAGHAAHGGTAANRPRGPPRPVAPPRRRRTPISISAIRTTTRPLPAGKPVKVWFGLRNMGVAPKDVKFPNNGHHHLLIDVDLPPMDKEIPNDRNHLHFGAGETETTVELAPGKHTLQLLMGDEKHIPTTPPVYSKKITI